MRSSRCVSVSFLTKKDFFVGLSGGCRVMEWKIWERDDGSHALHTSAHDLRVIGSS